MWPYHSIRGILSCLTYGACGHSLPVNPSRAGFANFVVRVLIWLVALCLVSSGLIGLYIIL